jgi:hypothetical protein
MRQRALTMMVTAAVGMFVAIPALPAAGGSAQATGLQGVFGIDETDCSTPLVTGSYFRMIQPGGTDAGPFVTNADSACTDKTYTPLAPGTQGGLSTVAYQGNPDPAFDALGNGLADKIHQPSSFFGVDFACSTNAADPQAEADVPLPVIESDGAGNLTGQTTAFSCAYNQQYFNQGSPKPDGETPGLTTDVTGTFVAATGTYTLEWRSTIVGGPFNNFTGIWHFEGTFKAAPKITFKAPNASTGKTIAMSGNMSPGSAGEEVKIQTQKKKKSGGYKKIDTKSATTDASGGFELDHPPLPAGRYRARAKVPETSTHARAKSSWDAFRVSAGSSGALLGSALVKGLFGSKAQTEGALYGLFEITPGQCGQAQGIDSGSYFQMTQPGGDPASGPYVENGDSPCEDKKVSPIKPGTDGGLSTSAYQPNPDPAFDNGGNGQAKAIHEPVKFFGVDFGCSTNETDPQTKDETTIPEIVADAAGALSGDTNAYSCAWNGQHFNQGAPKPDGSKPGSTSLLTGTYDSSTGAYELEWHSQIVGGPFDKFTGTWHLEGTFTEGAAPSGGPSGGSGGGTPQSSTVSGATSSASGATGDEVKGKSLAFTGSPIPGRLGEVLILLGASGMVAERIARRRKRLMQQELRW